MSELARMRPVDDHGDLHRLDTTLGVIVERSSHITTSPAGPPVLRPSLEDLLGPVLPAWRGAKVLVWRRDRSPVRQLLEGAGVDVREVGGSPDRSGGPTSLAELHIEGEDGATFDGAVAIDVLDAVDPDELIDALRWLHDRLDPGAALVARVSTDLIGVRAGAVRFCAATYMTAFRRAGFDFERLDRVLIDEDDPALVQAQARMRFHDPLELRTAALDALLVRPDRVNLADLALVTER